MNTVTFIFQTNTTKEYIKVEAVTMRQAMHKASIKAKVRECNLVFIRIVDIRSVA